MEIQNYLAAFDSDLDYEDFKESTDYITPNVSAIKGATTVYYNPIDSNYYKSMLFTLKFKGNGSLTLTPNDFDTYGFDYPTIEYSVNKGEWETTTITSAYTISVNSGDTIEFKSEDGIARSRVDQSNNYNYAYTTFDSTCNFDAYGNIRSISGIYYRMFIGCNHIIDASNIYMAEANDSVAGCFREMFYGCGNLIKGPKLPSEIGIEGCYYMFRGCSGLTTAPELPATALTQSCYFSMFIGCTSLTEAPELPATTLASNCYYQMFNGCTNLTTAPALPATALTNNCYDGMFSGCTSLTIAPELPATTLVQFCYNRMFYGCTNLNYIKAMFTTTPYTTYTDSWVYGVATTGTFVKNSAAAWDVTGVNGVPTNWTVETATPN